MHSPLELVVQYTSTTKTPLVSDGKKRWCKFLQYSLSVDVDTVCIISGWHSYNGCSVEFCESCSSIQSYCHVKCFFGIS